MMAPSLLPNRLGTISLSENCWRILILVLSVIVLLITVWCLSSGITTVFMHLYYFPIILLAYHYRWKGFVLAVFLSAAYLCIAGFFSIYIPETLPGAVFRFLVFCSIAAVIAWISVRLASAQEYFMRNHRFQESVITNANIWITVLAADGTVLVWNNAAEAISGYLKDSVVGKNTIWKQLYPDREYRRQVTGEIQRIIRMNSIVENFETRIQCADGSTKTIIWNTRSLNDTPGKKHRYIAIGRDITGEKAALQRLQESEAKYRTLIEKTNEAVIIAQDGRFVFTNASTARLLGVPVEELNGKPFSDFIWPDDRDMVTTRYQQRISGMAVPESYDFRIIGAGGRMRWVSITSARITWGDRPATLNLLTDITERKAMEEALRESESFNRGLVENLPDYLAVYALDGKLLYVNPASATALGYEPDSLIGRPVLSFVAEEYRELVQRMMTARLGTENPEPYEIELITRNQIRRSVLVKAAPIRYRNNPAILLLLVDITDRRKNEEALRESEEKYRLIVENSHDIIYTLSAEGVFLYVSPSWSAWLGHPVAEVTGQQILTFVHPDDAGRCLEAMEKVIGMGLRQSGIEYRVKHADGTWRWHTSSAVPLHDETGRIIGGEGIARDITEQKLMEIALQKSEHHSAMLVEAIPDLMFIISREGVYREFHVPDVSVLAVPAEKILGSNIRESGFGKESVDIIVENISRAIETKALQLFEYRIEIAGQVRLYEARMVAISDEEVLAIVRDITERKNAEAQIRESQQLFSDIISFLPDPTFVIDRDGKVLAWNRALEKLSGVAAGDMVGKGNHEYSLWQYGTRRPILIDLVLHPDRDAGRISYIDIRREDSVITAQSRITRGDGQTILLSLVASPLFDSQGNIVGAIESLRDITRIKDTEAELARLNTNLEDMVRKRTQALNDEVAHRIDAERNVQVALDYTRSVIEANPDLMVVLDMTGRILDINSAGEKLTGIPVHELVGQKYFGYLEDDGTLQSAFARLIEQGTVENFVRIRRTDGHLTPLSVHATVFKGLGNSADRIIVSAHDITRQKQDEEAIRASLDEKVILLREIHHRVKNNLQIIISLTNLQMRQTNDPGVRRIMAETQNRVRAMSLVHEKLYRSDSLSQIDFAEYTRYLATQLFSFYSMSGGRVNLDVTMKKIMMDINTAVPLGLIMNELVSNALKHAFPDDRHGTIRISGGQEGRTITLSVNDDGIGLPIDIDWENTDSLGMRLITSLVNQVGGSITLDRANGTSFTIIMERPAGI